MKANLHSVLSEIEKDKEQVLFAFGNHIEELESQEGILGEFELEAIAYAIGKSSVPGAKPLALLVKTSTMLDHLDLVLKHKVTWEHSPQGTIFLAEARKGGKFLDIYPFVGDKTKKKPRFVVPTKLPCGLKHLQLGAQGKGFSAIFVDGMLVIPS